VRAFGATAAGGDLGVELEFPIEFIVEGAPVSFQARRAESRNEWKARVKAASSSVLPEGYRASEGRMAVTLFYFPDGPMQGDVDNISQVERILVQKFEPENVFGFSSPSAKLKEALNRQAPVLYVRLSDEPFEDLV